MAGGTERKQQRIESVDAVRGLAVILMVFSHGLHWFHVEGSHAVISIGGLSLGDAAAPLFFVIAGIALSLSLVSRRRRGVSSRGAGAGYRRRFRQLFVLGIPISLLWGVLQAQAVVLGALVYLALHVFDRAAGEEGRSSPGAGPRAWPFAVAVASFIAHVVVGRVEADSYLWNLLFRGQFPVFAIGAFAAVGFGWGRFLQRPTWPRVYCVAGGLFAAAAFAAARLTGGPEGGQPMLRAHMPPPYVLAGIAATLLAVALLHAAPLRRLGVVRLLGALGRHALFLYLAHYGLMLVQVVVFGWWHALDTAGAVAASLLLVVMIGFIGLHFHIDARTIYGKMDAVARWWSGAPAATPPAENVAAAANKEEEAAADAAGAAWHVGGRRTWQSIVLFHRHPHLRE